MQPTDTKAKKASAKDSTLATVVTQFDDSALLRRGTEYRVISEAEHFGFATSPKNPLPNSFTIESSAWQKLLKPHDWAKVLQLPPEVSALVNREFWARGCVSADTPPTDEIIGYATRHIARYMDEQLNK